MARRLFFVPEIRRGMAELTGSDAEHLVRVLRAEVGQVYEISDNRRAYTARVTTARKSSVEFEVVEALPLAPFTAAVHLYPALFKFDHFEWMLEKATELGVTEIHPFEATRTDRGLRQASAKRAERWQRILLEASQQCRRYRRPELHPVVNANAAIAASHPLRLFLDEADTAPPLLDVAQLEAQEIALLLGPEGGWTEGERAQILERGWTQCSLGGTVLRAETAGIAGLAVVNAAWRR